MSVDETYLGDSVYAGGDCGGVTIWLDNGVGRNSEIYLEPETLAALVKFADRLGVIVAPYRALAAARADAGRLAAALRAMRTEIKHDPMAAQFFDERGLAAADAALAAHEALAKEGR